MTHCTECLKADVCRNNSDIIPNANCFYFTSKPHPRDPDLKNKLAYRAMEILLSNSTTPLHERAHVLIAKDAYDVANAMIAQAAREI